MQGLYALKPWYSRRLQVFTDGAVRRGVSPDAFTGAGVLFAAVAAVVIWQGWWWAALPALALRLAGANLDGAVARARGVSRPWGFVLNELGDRGSDMLMFAGLAALAARHQGTWEHLDVTLVLVAALAATLPTFASLSAAGAGAVRRNGGPFGKTERCLLAVVATAFPGLMPWWAGLFVAGALLTATTRLLATHRELSA